VLLLREGAPSRGKNRSGGDGLTPRAVKALIGMGVPGRGAGRWVRNKGPADSSAAGCGSELALARAVSSYPGYGLVRTRLDFDEILARTAQKRARGSWRRHRDRPGAR